MLINTNQNVAICGFVGTFYGDFNTLLCHSEPSGKVFWLTKDWL